MRPGDEDAPDTYEPGRLMGSFAVDTAHACQFTRADQDAYARRSRKRAIPAEKLTVNGGATTLDHPIGAGRARVVATLLGAPEARERRRDVAALSTGGGEAVAVEVGR